MCVKSSFTVVKLHELSSSYPRSILWQDIIGVVYEKWRATWGQAQILEGPFLLAPVWPIETPPHVSNSRTNQTTESGVNT